MRRATTLTITVGLLLALTAATAWAVTYNPVQCSTNPCNGTAGADAIYGTAAAETINAGLGDDRAVGRAGNDEVNGGDGNDTVNAEEGADTVRGSFGNDYLNGAAGADTIYGGPGDDSMYGTENDDTIYASGDASNRDYVDCGTGTDRAYLDSNDVVDGVLAQTVVVNTARSCERLYVNGVLIPTGP